MVYFKDNQWNISSKKVSYKDGLEEIEKFVGEEGTGWWDELALKHDDIEVVEFVDVVATEGQLARLEEVNTLSIPAGHSEVIGDYVNVGTFPDLPNHILKDLQFTKMFNIMLGVE